MIQAGINWVYRYPKAAIKRLRRFGGVITYLRMNAGRREMINRTADLPPTFSDEKGYEIFFLTGKRFIEQTLFCIRSLRKVTGEPFKFILIDDGSFDDELRRLVAKKLPGASVIAANETDALIAKNLSPANFPFLNRKRLAYPHIKKLTDIHLLPSDRPKLVLDSDMLFRKKPDAILEWLKNPDRPLCMLDCQESYGYSRRLMETLCGNHIPEKVNAGIIGLDSRSIDWVQLENWGAQLEAQEGGSYYLEQALTAMILSGKNPAVLSAGDYIVNPTDEAVQSGTGVLHHYVDLSKRAYFLTAWKKIL